MSKRSLGQMREEFLVAVFEGLINAGVVFLVGVTLVGINQKALEFSLILGVMRFISSIRELDWVTITQELPGNNSMSHKDLLKRSIMNVGRYV